MYAESVVWCIYVSTFVSVVCKCFVLLGLGSLVVTCFRVYV